MQWQRITYETSRESVIIGESLKTAGVNKDLGSCGVGEIDPVGHGIAEAGACIRLLRHLDWILFPVVSVSVQLIFSGNDSMRRLNKYWVCFQSAAKSASKESEG